MATKKKPAKKPRGRQSIYTLALGKRICDRLAKGEPLADICRDKGMPAVSTVSLWKAAHPEFDSSFARARSDGYDVLAAQCLTIANTPVEGQEITIKDDGREEIKRSDMLGHRKLQIETRLKLLAKWDPKRYGEKLAIGGADDLPAIKTAATMSDDDLAAIALGKMKA